MAKKVYNGLSLQNNRIIDLASPSLSTDAANKQYVDNLVNGLNWKNAVMAATTTSGTIATAYAAGQVIDGYTLVTGDHILIKNQSTASENGLYIVQATGAPQRSPDGTTGNLTTNTTVRINNGSVNNETAWTLSTDGTITVGTTNQSWVRSDSGTPYSAGNGISLASNTFSANLGAGLTFSGSQIVVDTNSVARRYTASIGDGTNTAYVVTHGFGRQSVTVTIYDSATFEEVDADVVHTSINTVTITFAAAPASSAFQVVIFG